MLCIDLNVTTNRQPIRFSFPPLLLAASSFLSLLRVHGYFWYALLQHHISKVSSFLLSAFLKIQVSETSVRNIRKFPKLYRWLQKRWQDKIMNTIFLHNIRTFTAEAGFSGIVFRVVGSGPFLKLQTFSLQPASLGLDDDNGTTPNLFGWREFSLHKTYYKTESPIAGGAEDKWTWLQHRHSKVWSFKKRAQQSGRWCHWNDFLNKCEYDNKMQFLWTISSNIKFLSFNVNFLW